MKNMLHCKQLDHVRGHQVLLKLQIPIRYVPLRSILTSWAPCQFSWSVPQHCSGRNMSSNTLLNRYQHWQSAPAGRKGLQSPSICQCCLLALSQVGYSEPVTTMQLARGALSIQLHVLPWCFSKGLEWFGTESILTFFSVTLRSSRRLLSWLVLPAGFPHPPQRIQWRCSETP